jgi:hypothetical protein
MKNREEWRLIVPEAKAHSESCSTEGKGKEGRKILREIERLEKETSDQF